MASGLGLTSDQYPSLVQIDVSNFCNLKCPLCSNRDRRNQVPVKKGNMSLADFKVVAGKLKSAPRFIFGAKNEPLMNRDIFSMIRHLSDLNPKVETELLTNLTTAGQFKMEEIVGSRVQRISVGMDGIDPQMYAKYRVGGDFNAVVENIRAIQGFKARQGVELPSLEILFIVFRHNEHALDEARALARRLGCKITFLRTNFYEGLEAWFPRRTGLDAGAARVPAEGSAPREGVSCLDPWRKMNVYHDGLVCTCSSEARIPAGNIFKSSFEEIWNGKVYQSTRARILGRLESVTEPDDCETCPVYRGQGTIGTILGPA